MVEPMWMWGVFIAVVTILMVIDLGVLHRKDKEIGVKESLIFSGTYISISLLFGAFVWWQLGEAKGKEYYTGYIVEKTLAMDNIFVMSLIFSYFAIPLKFQHRVLFWGIMGVIVLRGVAIGAGAALVANFEWVLLLFAGFLVITGIKILFSNDEETDISNNQILLFLRKHLRVTDTLHGNKFWVRMPHAKKADKDARYYTPLFLALVLIEFADLIFALDSIPAIFAITTDPYIVYTSNIFAVLGLRALYFALAASIHRFHYLKYALALILIFIGGKVFVAEYLLDGHIPASVSLGVTLALLGGGVLFSLFRTKSDAPPLVQDAQEQRDREQQP